MKSYRLFAAVLCVALCGLVVHAQDMDTAITKLTEDVAAKIKDNGNKKITVLDFTDLQGGTSELGKYIAEQLTVDFVMTKRDFSVLDRANLKRILDEHKLSASGLIDPENAKQLGKFAGVDAMIFGTVVPVGNNINVAVKVITTETAEVVGGAKTKFAADESVQQLLSQSAQASDSSGKPAPSEKPFGELQGKIESLNVTPGDGHYGYATMTLIITNTSKSLTYGVAVNPDFYKNFNLSDSQGNVFRATEVKGVETLFQGFGGYRGSITGIAPKSAITITAKSQVGWTGQAGEYRPYHFETEVLFGEAAKGNISEVKKYNLVLEMK